MWRVAAKLAISAALIWLVVRTQDIGTLLQEIGMVDRGALAISILMFVALCVPLTLRWSAILKNMGTPILFRITFPLVMVGQFFSQGLPSSMGDVVRVWLAHCAGLPAWNAINSVLLDRLMGLFTLFVVATAGLPRLYALAPGPAVTHGVVTVILLGYAGFAFAAMLHRMPQCLIRFRIVRIVAQLSIDLRSLLFSPKAMAKVLLNGLIMQTGTVVIVYILGKGLGLRIGMLDCLLIVPLANLVQSVPISIAGWGVREGFFVAAFAFAGVAPSSALAMSVLYGLVTAVASLPGGAIWLLRGRHKTDKLPLVTAQREAVILLDVSGDVAVGSNLREP